MARAGARGHRRPPRAPIRRRRPSSASRRDGDGADAATRSPRRARPRRPRRQPCAATRGRRVRPRASGSARTRPIVYRFFAAMAASTAVFTVVGGRSWPTRPSPWRRGTCRSASAASASVIAVAAVVRSVFIAAMSAAVPLPFGAFVEQAPAASVSSGLRVADGLRWRRSSPSPCRRRRRPRPSRPRP
ncbi:MAG: hypothetical protein MZV70_43390 [Desulfobacterales bacterium]|nr:hypothetical protein [Desulfobacterales bacterium]